MNPDAHDKALWDDDPFSQSRRFFWTIHCLTDLQISISNNIAEWEKYCKANVERSRTSEVFQMDSVKQIEENDDICRVMEAIRSDFAAKLTSTQALRHGVCYIKLLNYVG